MEDIKLERWLFVREEDWKKVKDDLAREVALGELMRKAHVPLVQERDALRDANIELRQQRDRARDLFMAEKQELAVLRAANDDLKSQIDTLLRVNRQIGDEHTAMKRRAELLRAALQVILDYQWALTDSYTTVYNEHVIIARAALAADAPAKVVMTPKHPRWSEFLTALEGPDGCNFHVDEKCGRAHWSCGGDNKHYTEAILTRMGGIDVPASLDFFDTHGGHCDCEILFSVKDDAEDA